MEEMDIEEARKLVSSNKTRFVWLGGEPRIDMAEALGIGKDRFTVMRPDAVYHADRALAESLSKSVLVCPHGNSSLFLAQHLMEEFNVEVYSLHGGISAIVGENNY